MGTLKTSNTNGHVYISALHDIYSRTLLYFRSVKKKNKTAEIMHALLDLCCKTVLKSSLI